MDLQFVTQAAKLRVVVDSIDHEFDFKFEASESGLVLNMLDDAQVWFFQIKLAPDYFNVYRCNSDTKFAVNSAQLKATLKTIAPDDEVEIAFSEQDQTFHINSAGINGSHRRFAQLKPVAVSGDAIQVPEAEYPARAELAPKLLGAVLRDVGGLAAVPLAALRIEPDGLTVTAKGDGRSLEHSLGNGGVTVCMAADAGKSLVVKFQTALLLRAVKAMENCESMLLGVREHYPLKLQCPLAADGSSYVMHYVLPQLD